MESKAEATDPVEGHLSIFCRTAVVHLRLVPNNYSSAVYSLLRRDTFGRHADFLNAVVRRFMKKWPERPPARQ